MSDNKEIGYVYILTNPSFREDWVKIGKSSRPVDVRSKELRIGLRLVKVHVLLMYAQRNWITQRFRFHLRFSLQ